MKRTTFTILFFVKWKKPLKNGEVPIYMRITVNGESKEISLKRSVLPKLWNATRSRVKGNSSKSNEINDYLTSIRGQLYNYQRNLQESGRPVTPKALCDAFLGIGEKQWTLVELFQDHNDSMERLIGKEYSPLTLQRFNAALKHIRSFCKIQYKNEDLLLSEVNNKFISSFEFYLKTNAKCQHNSAMKHIKALKKVIRIALANDFIRKNPFANYKITHKAVDRNCLTETELKKLIEKELTVKRIEVIRDLFVFQCYTGLAYKDLVNLSIEHIQIGIDKNKWIIMKRGKTGVEFRIPLLPIAENILNKYRNDPNCLIGNKLLPVPSNQKMNAYLKEVADLCGINKKLHTHLARHTYATTITLSNGVSMETVSKLLGHSKIQTTQMYSKVLDTKISQEIEGLRKSMI